MPVPTTTTLDVDPLAKVLEPPPNESPEESDARLAAEATARRISEGIDEELERERSAEKKGVKPLKMLLLGQSESGKSTTLKNLQLLYDYKKFRLESSSWRAVIQLNIVRSVHLILDAIIQSPADPESSSSNSPPPLSSDLLKLKMRLSPLRQVEDALIRRLTAEGTSGAHITIRNYDSHIDRSKEVEINSASTWKEMFAKPSKPDHKVERAASWHGPNDPSIVLNACAQDISLLWNDPTVKMILKRQNIHVEEMAGFFLDSLERVTAADYTPSDEDVLRARLKTLGVSEHRFKIKPEHGPMREWRVFDVGGHRSLPPEMYYIKYFEVGTVLTDGYSTAAWVPYFDDMDAIIFLAPISAFDQNLSEDPSTNRLEDSVNIWNYIVQNELLKHTHLILFMNKIDILKAKIESGIKFSDYVVSYGARRGRENDVRSITKYLKEKFSGILRERSTTERAFYCHLTTVTNFEATKEILKRVRDILMQKHLQDAVLI